MEAGAVAAARRHSSCAGLRGSRSRWKSEPELLREVGPYWQEAELYGGGGAKTGRDAVLKMGERTTARKPNGACVRPKASR